MYTIIANFDRGPSTYTANSEEDALAIMDKFYEGGVACVASDQDGNVVDENDLTDLIDGRNLG